MLEIVYKTTAELTPYANNSRTHSAAQVAQVAASITEFGFTNPVLIDDDGSIIAGHGRVQAAKNLALDEIPTITLPGLTTEQKKAYAIADNQLALNAGWDLDLLKIEINNLVDADFDLDLLGFDEDFLAGLTDEEQTEGLTDEDAVPDAPETPVTVLGDIWILGNHRLMCGDSTSIDAVDRLMDGGKIDLVFTSPPYNQGGWKGVFFSHGKRVESLYQNDFDNKSSQEYFDFCISIFNSIVPFVSDVYTIAWNVAYNAKSRDDYGKILFSDANPFDVKETIIWNKGGSINIPQPGIYSRKCEFIFIMTANQKYLTSQIYGDCRWNYWETKKIKQRHDHKATFTVELSDMGLDQFSFNSNVVYDPFGGSGTTMISCEKSARHCRMMELDPKYCDVIIKRWQAFTGKQAVHIDGQLFDEVADD